MDTKQINAILEYDLWPKNVYHGKFPMNQLPTLQREAYIINTDDHDEPGEHCLAVYFDKDAEYVDSFELFPLDSRLEFFLGEGYVYNAAPMQQIFF